MNNVVKSLLIIASIIPGAAVAAPPPCAFTSPYLEIESFYKKGAILIMGDGGPHTTVRYGVRVINSENVISMVASAIARSGQVSVNSAYPACPVSSTGEGGEVAGGDVITIGISNWW